MLAIRKRRVVVFLFLLSFTVYTVTAGGHFYSSDSWEAFLSTESIVEYHSLQIVKPSFEGESPPSWLLFHTPDGKIYSRYGLGQTVLFIPFYLAGRLMNPNAELTHFSDFAKYFYLTDFLFNPTITAFTAAAMFYLGRKIGFSERMSVALALIFCFATQAWPYAKTLYNGPLVGLCVSVSTYYLWSPKRRLDLLWAGLLAGFAGFVRYEFMIFGIPIGLYILCVWRGSLRNRLSAWACFCIPLIGWVVVNALYDFARVGSIFVTPLRPNPGYDTPILQGLYGLLFSPGVGLFVYSPILILSLVGFYDFWQRNKKGLVLLLTWVLPYLLASSAYTYWHGWASWGTRYLVPMVPLMVLALGVAIDRRWATRQFRIVFAVLLSASGLVNFLGVVGNTVTAFNMPNGIMSLLENGEFVPAKALYDPRYSPIVYHARLIFDSAELPLNVRLDVPLFYTLSQPLQFAVWTLFAIAIGTFAFGLLRELSVL